MSDNVGLCQLNTRRLEEMGDNRIPSKDPEINQAEAVNEKLLTEKSFEDVTVEEKLPADKYNLVYIILLIHGVGVLMPWNMFITANSYFVDYKLKPVVHENSTDNLETTGTAYRDYFLSSLCFVAQIPNVLLNGVNLFYPSKSGNTSIRVIACILIIIAVFFFTVILAIVDSSSWQTGFFWITMVSVVIINSANGVYQNCVYGLSACLPMKYTNAVIIGSNISGALAALIGLVSMLVAPDIRTSAIYYFCFAILILFVAFGTFFLLRKLTFYKHYSSKAEQTAKDNSNDDNANHYLQQYSIVFKTCWKEFLNVFLVFFVTLCCFPAIQAGVAPVSDNFFIPAHLFTMFTCFVFFNVFAVIGSTLTTVVKFPGPKWIWLPIALRILFIPFFMFCNFRPGNRRLPVLFANDYVYCIGGILMALSSGYLSSLAMMFAPRKVADTKKGIAGMMAALALILGIFAGIIFSFPVILIIEQHQQPHLVDPYTTVSPLLNASMSGL